VQVNRPLKDEFARALAMLEWDVALLQEAPPRWLERLCRTTGSAGASALTSRNAGAAARALLAWLNPDLTASAEGGSNQILVRQPWRIESIRRHTIASRPERRRMIHATLAAPGGERLAVANLHASTGGGPAARREVVSAASTAVGWAGPAPLVFGGDLNLTPAGAPETFERLAALGLTGATGPDAIDHLLARGARPVELPRPLPPERRELPADGGRAIRLSDHDVVVATFEVE
jgi:endonuclease/exonuclease/phosphatase family metal-dependent hydrolase